MLFGPSGVGGVLDARDPFSVGAPDVGFRAVPGVVSGFDGSLYFFFVYRFNRVHCFFPDDRVRRVDGFFLQEVM